MSVASPPAVGAVIVHRGFQRHGVLQGMNLTNIKVGNYIAPDLIFPDCAPSLAIVFCDLSTLNQGTIKKFEDTQKQFKHCVGIAVGFDEDETWTLFQLLIDCGNMAIFRVPDELSAAALAHQCHREFSNKEKFDLQAAFFRNEVARISSSLTARIVIMETFNRLAIPEEDGNILVDGFPTLQGLVIADKINLSENSPASLDSINKLAMFFN